MGVLFLDIETIPQDPEPFMVPRAEDLTAPANYKDPVKIAEYIAEKAASVVGELRDKSSLEPLLGGTVLAVGIAVDDGPPKALLAPTGDEAGERAVLAQLEVGLCHPKNQGALLVTWNGARFDFEYLRKRALRHGLYDLAGRVFFDKPWSKGQVDLFPIWQGPNREAKGRLQAVAAYLGIESDDTVTGKDIASLYAAGDLEAVKHHVLEDVRITREVYYRFCRAGWIPAGTAVPEALPVRPLRVAP